MSVVVGILSCAASLNAGMLVVSGYSQIAGARFYDAPASDILSPVILNCTLDHLNCVKITPGSSSLNESFGGVNVPQYGPDVPGDGAGFGSDSTGFGGAGSITLNFSVPVAAFGATFVHFYNVSLDPSFTWPATIQVFSGADASGELLGTVSDSDGNVKLQGGAFADFRGLWTDSQLIGSAVISGASSFGGFQVDGYAISSIPLPPPSVSRFQLNNAITTIPVPEPMPLVLVGAGLIGLGIIRSYRKK
jgi:hypothetical protein